MPLRVCQNACNNFHKGKKSKRNSLACFPKTLTRKPGFLDRVERNYYTVSMRMSRNLKQARPWPVTTQRKLILDILQEAGTHIDAKEVYRRANERDPRISVATVYRSLQLFRETGLVDEKRLGQVRCCYEIKRSGEHHHLVCQSCGRIIDVESPLIQQLVMEVQQKNKFHVTRAELCLEGYCGECEEKHEKQSKLTNFAGHSLQGRFEDNT